MIVRQLAKAMKFASPRICAGVGHMGPLTHPDAVGAVMAFSSNDRNPGERQTRLHCGSQRKHNLLDSAAGAREWIIVASHRPAKFSLV